MPGASQSAHPRQCGRLAPRPRWNFLCSVTLRSPDHLLAPARMPVGEGRGSRSLPAAWTFKSVQMNVIWGRTQHRSKATRGPRTLPFTCQLQRPRARRHVSQVAPRAAPAPVLRLMGTPTDGKRRGGTPASPATERKGKETRGALAWKRRE